MTVIIWKCKLCGSIQVSNSKKHHEMDICKCGETGMDLEDYGCRWMANNPKSIIELKRIEHTGADIWTELMIDMVEQNLTLDLTPIIKNPCIDSSQALILNQIEKEVYLSLL